MIARDSEVRRLVETGLSSYSLMGYADACDATGDVLADLADKILPISYLDRDRQPLRGLGSMPHTGRRWLSRPRQSRQITPSATGSL
jgi:hypothetical protein